MSIYSYSKFNIHTQNYTHVDIKKKTFETHTHRENTPKRLPQMLAKSAAFTYLHSQAGRLANIEDTPK